jgi:pyruvate,water dikinase
MEMVDAEAAGVGFSCNPRTGREDRTVINANFGLGESVVGGLVAPDEYHLCQGILFPVIHEKHIGSKEGLTTAKEGGGSEFIAADVSSGNRGENRQVLTDSQIIRLARLIVRVFEALGKGEQHQDVEWVLAGNEFHLVQARPVTALPRYTYPALRGQPDIWSNANFRDAIPMVLSTLGWRGMSATIAHVIETPLRMAGYPYLPGVKYTKLHNGRAYYNIAVQQWEFYDSFGVTPGETNELVGGHQPEIETENGDTVPKLSRIGRFYRRMRHLRNILHVRRKATQRIAQIRDYCDQCLKRDCTGMRDDELIGSMGDVVTTRLEFAETFALLSCGSGFINLLTKTLERYFPGRANAVANALLMGNGSITSAEHGFRLLELAECARKEPSVCHFFSSEPFEPFRWKSDLPENSNFKTAFSAFLDQYGHRAVYEADVANPRWREDPSYLLSFIRDVIETADTRKIKVKQEQRRKATWLKLKEELTWFRFKTIRWLVSQATKGAETREQGKSEIVRFLEVFRMMSLEIGRRLAERRIIDRPRDVFHCALSELLAVLKGEWDGVGLKVLVAERREEQERLEKLSPPDLIVDGQSRYIEAEASVPHGKGLTGLGVAAGRASGRTRLITHPYEGARLKQGEVLVAPSTDPGWTPLFLKASAIVMETGGFLSHGAIVAREYGIPAVCNVPGVMGLLKEGLSVTVDGDEGKFYLDE